MDEEHIDLSSLNDGEFRGTELQHSYFNERDEEFDIPPEDEEQKVDPAILDQTRVFDFYCQQMQMRYPQEYEEHENRRN